MSVVAVNGTGPVIEADNPIIPNPPDQPLIVLLCLGCSDREVQVMAPPPTPSGSPVAAPAPSPAPFSGDLRRAEILYGPLIANLRTRGANVVVCPDTDSILRVAFREFAHAIIVVDDKLFRPDSAGDRYLEDVLDNLMVYAHAGGRLIFWPNFDGRGALQPMFNDRFGLDWQIRGHYTTEVKRGGWLDLVREEFLERMPENYHTTAWFIDSAAPAFPLYFSTGLLRETNKRMVSAAAARVGIEGWLFYFGDDISQREMDEVITVFCGL